MAPSHRAMQPRPPKQDQLCFLRISGGYLQNCHHGRSTDSGSSFQWEAEGRVPLDGAELELCQECKAPVHHYGPDGAPYCETHGPGL